MKTLAVMLCLALSAPLANAGRVYVPPAPKPSDTYRAQRDVITKINSLFPNVEVDVRWAPCGEMNAFYDVEEKTILLCTELEEHPGLAVFAAAHEMGHALTHQLTSVTSEQSADEIAALSLIKFGYQKELLEAAVYFAAGRPAHVPGDEHPGAGFRAWELACIETGSDGGSAECRALYQGLRVIWNTRLRNP